MVFAPELALHDVTRDLSAAFVRDTHSGLLLYGGEGSGLLTLAGTIARSINDHPDGAIVIGPENGKDIPIEQVRKLYHDTRSKRASHLVVIIDEADRMSVPAQNAFLKLLEEPPENVIFIMTTHLPQMLLSTIHSRVATIEVRPISVEASRQMIMAHGDIEPTKQSQLLFLASGRPAGLKKLLEDEVYFEKRADVTRLARSVVQGSTYQRLIYLKDAMNDRVKALELVRTMGDIIKFGSVKSPSHQAARQLDVIADGIEQLEANANVRLQLLHLALYL